jgi:hypothetical protein
MNNILLFLLFQFLLSNLNVRDSIWLETEGDCFIMNIGVFDKALTKSELKVLEVAEGTHIKSNFDAEAGICLATFKNI